MTFIFKPYFFIILFLVSCQPDTSENAAIHAHSGSAFSPLPEWETNHEQELFIDATQDTLIQCSNGIAVFFPANTFKPKQGTPIKLVIASYMGVEDYLLSGLTTSSHGLPLQSGGMLKILAYENNVPIELNNGCYRVYFPRKKNVDFDSMSAFLGIEKEGKMEWQLQSPTVADTNFSDTSFLPVKPIPFTVKKVYRGYKGYGEGILKRTNSDTTLYDYLKAHYNPPPEALYQLSLGDTVKFSLMVNVDEKNKAILNGDGYLSFTNTDGKMLDVYQSENLLEYTKAFSRNLPLFHCPLWESGYETYEFSFFCPGPSYSSKLKLEHMNLNDADYYVLHFLKLGWINCDRFISDKELVTIELEAESDTKNYLVFNNSETLLYGDRDTISIKFRKIPKGESITFVSIKAKNNDPTISVIDLISADIKIKPKDYRPYSLDQLKKELQRRKK